MMNSVKLQHYSSIESISIRKNIFFDNVSHKHTFKLHSAVKYYENFVTCQAEATINPNSNYFNNWKKVTFTMTNDNDKLNSWFWQVIGCVTLCVWECESR